MNPIDQENKEAVELEEQEDDENIDNSDELEQKKQNVFNAEGNTAWVQVFVNSLGELNMNYKQSVEKKENTAAGKSYDLSKLDECTEFVEQFKNSEYLATAIILCTFEMIPLADLSDLQKYLMECLPVAQLHNGVETEEHDGQKNPYISLKTILAVIRGKRFVREDGQVCIGFGDGAEIALANILEQFPILKERIVSWLIQINKLSRYHTAFYTYQIATAFERVIAFDLADARQRIFPELYKDSKNAGLLGMLAYRLYENTAMQQDVDNMVLQWMQEQREWVWLWKSASLAYSVLIEKGCRVSFDLKLQKTISKRILYFRKDDAIFIAALLIQSKYLRSMFANAIYDAFHREKERTGKLRIVQVYINIVRHSYYLVSESFVELPLVACDTKKQQEYIMPVIEQAMSVYHLRKQLYVILKTYLKELSVYEYSERVLNHMCAYFYVMTLSGENYRQEILEILKKSNNRISAQIYQRLSGV